MLSAELQQAIEATEKHGSKAAAARALGISASTLKDRLERVKRTRQGISPFNTSEGIKPPPQDFHCRIRAVPKPATNVPKSGTSRRHLIIPDVQAKPGVDLSHLDDIGRYIADKRPDVVIQIGDFADMPSLSSYDVGKRSFEGRRYKDDIKASHEAMRRLCEPFVGQYKPRMVLTLGNHCHRITRATDDDAKLDGTIGLADLEYEKWGWEVYPFLEPVKVDGITYVHYVTSGAMGRPCASAQIALREIAGSVVQGHVQHHDICIHRKTQRFALFSGIAYTHQEDYLGPQGQGAKAGVWVLNECDGEGNADLMFVSLNYLKKKYRG